MFQKTQSPASTVSGVFHALHELEKFATAARAKRFSGGQAAGKSGHYLMAVGKLFIRDNLENIPDETVRLGCNAETLAKRNLMYLLKCQDLITD